MRFRLLFFASILANIIAGSSLHAQWTNLSTSQALNVSDTTITQYAFSEDHKSVFVLDARNSLKKFNLKTGNMVWSRNLLLKKHKDFLLFKAELSQKGDIFSLCFYKNDSLILICNDINTDENKYILGMKKYITNSTTSYMFSDNNLYFFNYYESQTSGKNFYYEKDGVAWTYSVNNFQPWYSDYFKLNSYISGKVSIDNSSSLINSSFIKFRWEDGYVKENNCNYRLVTYNPNLRKWSVLSITEFSFGSNSIPNPYKAFSISDNGLFSAVQNEYYLCTYDNINAKMQRKRSHVNRISSIMFSPDNKNLFVGAENKIEVYNSSDLELKNKLEVPELNGFPELINSYSDAENVYFTSKNRIFRINTIYYSDSLEANFYKNTTISLAGEPVRFFDASTGSPDSYSWDFGDGKTSTEQSPTHVYADSGLYDVKLIVKKENLRDSLILAKSVKVLPKLVSDFSFVVDESGCLPKVAFTNFSRGSIDSVIWYFGDKGISREYNPVHYFSFTNEYPVTLKIFSSIFSKDTTIIIKVHEHMPELDKSRFEYELAFQDDSASYSAQAYVQLDGTILYNRMKGQQGYIVKADKSYEAVLNEKSPYSNGVLRSINSMSYVYSTGSHLLFMDNDGIIIKHLDLYYGINSINVIDNLVAVGIVLYDNGNKVNAIFKLYSADGTLRVDSTFSYYYTCVNLLDHFSGQINASYYHNSIEIMLRFIIRYRCLVGSTPLKYEDRAGMAYKLNRFSVNKDINLPFLSACRVKIGLMAVSFENGLLSAFNDSAIVIWEKYIGNKPRFNSLLKLNDTCFIAVGSIDEKPGYAIFNDKGDIIDSATLDCRFGAFLHVSVTPDTNLLLSGYKSIDAFGGKVPYFVKTNSKLVQSLVLGAYLEYTGIDENIGTNPDLIVPNPANDFIEIPGVVGSVERIRIYSTDGACVFDGRYSQKIDVSYLDKGMYFVMAGDKVFKFIKL